MKIKKNLNNRGFLLVETLITSLFIMSIFALLYTNMFPLMGNYERYQKYDTVESVYIAHWARKLALRGLADSTFNTAKTNGYINVTDCFLYQKDGKQDTVNWCSAFKDANNVKQIYLTDYKLGKKTNSDPARFKEYVKTSTLSRSFQEYIDYLPTAANNTNKTATKGYYRIIIEYEKNNDMYYGTIEVVK